MADPGLAEVASLAATPENQLPNPANRTQRLARDVTRDVAENHFREGLRKHAEAKDVDFGGFDRKIAGFGVVVDDTTAERTLTPEEEDYRTSVETARDLLTRFFDVGYDGMGADQARLRDIIILQARRNPAMAAQVAALAGNEQAFAERFIRDPHFSAFLKETLSDNLEGNFDNTVLDAFDAWQTKEQTRQDAEDRLTEIQRRRDLSEARLRPFDRNARTGNPTARAANAREIDRIQNASSQHTIDIAQHQQQISQYEGRLSQLSTELSQAQQRTEMRPLNEINSDILQVQQDVAAARAAFTTNPNRNTQAAVAMAQAELGSIREEKAARQQILTARSAAVIQREIDNIQNTLLPQERTDLATKQADLLKVEGLETREQDLEVARAEFETQLAEAQAALRTAEGETNIARRNYDNARMVRLAAEKTFSERITNAFGEAGSKTINSYLESIAKEYGPSLAKMKDEEKEENAREALTAIQSRWQMPPIERQRGPWWNRRVEYHRPINKQAVGADFDTLLNQGDRELVRNIMTGRNRPGSVPPTPYTADEINSLLDNSEFMQKIGPEATKQLFGQRFLTGGFRREDINIIARTAWGPGQLEKAIEQNAAVKRSVSLVMGEGAFNRSGFRENFGKVANEKPWLIYSLMGIPIAAILAIFGDAASELTQNQN